MANTGHSTKKPATELASDQQLIVEEKIVKVGGETTVRKYVKGRYLGKVKPTRTTLREDLHDATSSRTWRQSEYPPPKLCPRLR